MHVLSARQFDLQTINKLFDRTSLMERILKRGGTKDYEGKIMSLLFYEPSTRTRFCFEASMLRLGGSVISTEKADVFSSEIKDSDVKDTVRAISSFCDIIVIRHPEAGTSLSASGVSDVPIINGGEGSGEHPTQALLDLYTIYKERGHLEGLKVAFIGDVANGRTIKSLAYFLAKYARTMLFFVCPPLFKPDNSLTQYLDEMKCSYDILQQIHMLPDDIDVLYVTRLHKSSFQDRVDDYYHWVEKLTITRAELNRFTKNPTIMHPLPRGPELPKELDKISNFACFRQNQNGLSTRMALISMLLDGEI